MPEIRSGNTRPDHSPASRKKSPLKLIVSILAAIVVAVLVGWGLTQCSKSAEPGQGGPGGAGAAGGRGRGGGGRFGGRAAITVGTAPVTLGNIPITLDGLGTVTPPITATVTTRISGNLMAVYFKEGQTVKKGQKLALIDPRPYQVALEQAQGTMARDEAALADAQLDLKRYQTLVAQNSLATQQLDTQSALVKQDEGAVKTDKAAVDNAKLNLDYTTITAPAAGRVGLRQVDIGNYIPAGSTTGLVVLTQIDPIDVVFTIPEDNVPQINQRERAGASLPVTVFDRGGGEVLANGALSTLDNQIDTSTGTVKAKARFANSSGALFPNQFVNARLLIDNLCNATIVPATAVRHGSQGDYVFILQPDQTAKLVLIKTGPGTAETVSIASGLAVGQTVITEGGDRLTDGAKVNLPGQRTPGSGFSGGRRGRRGGQGQGGQAQGGQSGGRGAGGRRGGGGQPQVAQVNDVATQIQNSDAQGLQSPGLAAPQTPPGACPAPGQGGKGQGGGRFHQGQGGSGQGGQDAQAKGQGQGFPGRRHGGANGPGPNGQAGAATDQGDQGQGQRRFRRRPNQDQANPGQGG